MDCQQCGYAMGPFDRACPKCARRARFGAGAAVKIAYAADGQPCKVCPACAQPAALPMPRCGRCGFDYALAANANPAPVLENPRYAARDSGRFGNWAAGIFAAVCLALVVGISLRSYAPFGRAGASLWPTAHGANTRGAGLFGAIDDRQITARLASASATTGGAVEVSLAWDTLSDLDLQARDPYGELITASHPHSVSGGAQDVDANPTLLTSEGTALVEAGRPCGAANVLPLPDFMVDMDKTLKMPEGYPDLNSLPNGNKARSRYTRTPIEHIYFQQAPHGVYTVYARCYSWREPNRQPLPFTIQVRSHGKVLLTKTATLGPASFVIDGIAPAQVCQFMIP